MSGFTSVYPEVSALDPNKRVNYVHGLVLGVDEFKQQEFYLLEKDRLHNRTLHGYGTVCGLNVSQSEVSTGREIRITPGLAINACGQTIQVPHTQCAIMEEWLASHSEEIIESLGSPASGPLDLYLMLCYRECKTDLVPIPSGPCQSMEDTTAASRIADDFSLSFQLSEPPEYHLQSPVTALKDLLLSIPIEADGAMTLEALQERVRLLNPDYEGASSSPPDADAIAPENLEAFFKEALLVWVTEVKPCLMSCAESLPGDATKNCVFLGQLTMDVSISEGIVQLESEVTIDESKRQFILATQDLQNLYGSLSLGAESSPGGAVPDAPGPAIDPVELVHIAGAETITGPKTFAAPVQLQGDARVTKTISLPVTQAHFGRGAARGLFADTLPALHLMTRGANAFSGEATFSFTPPEDWDTSRRIQFRLVWGFQENTDSSDIRFHWQVGGRFYQPGDPVDSFEAVEVEIAERADQSDRVLVTPFQHFNTSVAMNGRHQYGAIHVSLINPDTTLPQIYLLQVDLRYTANRLGGRLS